MDINITDFIESFKDILDEPELVEIKEGTEFKDIDEWDSLTNLTLIAMVDSEYNVKLNSDDITKSKTVLDLTNLIKSKQ